MRQTSLILLGAVLLAAVGCQEQRQQQPKSVSTSDWPGWTGDTTIDPAGDVAKLQGKWSRVSQGVGWDEAWLVFEGDTATFEYPALGDGGRTREPGQQPYVDRYRYVLNSSVEPKVIRFVHRFGEGEALSVSRVPRNEYYKLEGNTMSIWNHWAQRGEAPKYSYKRDQTK